MPTAELMLWVQSGDLHGETDGAMVSSWMDRSSKQRHLRTSASVNSPTLKLDGHAGFPAVVFGGDRNAEPPVNHFFLLPFNGEWRGITVFVAGKGLAGRGWFDTAPWMPGCLRPYGGVVQIAGTRIASPGIPASFNRETFGVATISASMGYDGVLHLATFANGQLLGQTDDTDANFSVIFRDGHIGNNNRGNDGLFNGELSEIIVYRGQLADKERQAVEAYLLAKYALAEKTPATPELPVGYTPPEDPAKNPPPPITLTPFQQGLQLWMRADDIIDVADGAAVEHAPNAAGNKSPLTSAGANRPKLALGAMNRRNTLKFEGSYTPKIRTWLKMPLQGEWDEVTVLVAGTNLRSAGVFDSAPWFGGCLRTQGYLQLAGSTLVLGDPFPLLRQAEIPQIIAFSVGKLGENGQFLASYANTHAQGRAEDPNARVAVRFRDPHLGVNNLGDNFFNGEIAEVLVYNRVLSNEERRQSEEYLAEKWGVPLITPEQYAREKAARSRWTTLMHQLPRQMSWLGNTFSGKHAHSGMHVQSGIADIDVFPDGTLIAASIWDEPHKELGLYKDGLPVRGTGVGGGCSAITYDDEFIYLGHSGMGKNFSGIRRHKRADLKVAPWPEMTGTNDWPTFPTPAPWNEVQGIALSGNELFVTCARVEEVRVYDKTTGKFTRTVPLQRAGRMATDNEGKLWIALPGAIRQFTTDIIPTGKEITIDRVGDMTIDGKGRLVVAENRERYQIIFYDLTGPAPREVAAFGEPGGVYVAPRTGMLSPQRLSETRGLGVDAAGNIYTNSSGILRSYTPDWQLRWEIFSAEFCTMGDFDPESDGLDFYTPKWHYRYRDGEPAGKDWVLRGTSVPNSIPELADADAPNVLVRRFNGLLYRFALGNSLQIHRQEAPDSAIFIPCGQYFSREYKTLPRPQAAPEKGRYYWCDRNGNGLVEEGEFSLPAAEAKATREYFHLFVDANGDLWEPQDRFGIRHIPLQGFTPEGVPIYDLEKEEWFTRPVEFSQIQRAYYDPKTDTMILSGTTWDNPGVGSEHWGCAGREAIRYDNWSTPERQLRSRMVYPIEAVSIRCIDISFDAELLVAAEMETSVIFFYDTKTGRLLGIVEPDVEMFGGVGWVDTDAAVRIFRRQDGEIWVMQEDSWSQKQMFYRMPSVEEWGKQ